MVSYTSRSTLKGKNSCSSPSNGKKPKRPHPEPYSIGFSPRTRHRRKLSEISGDLMTGSTTDTATCSDAVMVSSTPEDSLSGADAASLLLHEFEFGGGNYGNAEADAGADSNTDMDVDKLVWPKSREDCAWVAEKVSRASWTSPGLLESLGLGTGARRSISKRSATVKRMDVDEDEFRDEIVGYGVRVSGGPCSGAMIDTGIGASYGAKKARSKGIRTDEATGVVPKAQGLHSGAGLRTKAKAITLESTVPLVPALNGVDRQPLRDITSDITSDKNKDEDSYETRDGRDKEMKEKPTLTLSPTRAIPAGWHRALASLLNQAEKLRDGSSSPTTSRTAKI